MQMIDMKNRLFCVLYVAYLPYDTQCALWRRLMFSFALLLKDTHNTLKKIVNSFMKTLGARSLRYKRYFKCCTMIFIGLYVL